MRQSFRALTLAVALLLPLASQAETHENVAFDPSRFAEQKAAIEEGLSGKQYSEMADADRQAVRAALSRIEAALAGKTSLDELDAEAKVAIFNDQELVNTRLTLAAEDSRMVCRREKKLGSNLPTNVCMTVAQRREAMDRAQDELRRTNRSALPRVQ